MRNGSHHESFGWHLLRATPVLLGITFIVHALFGGVLLLSADVAALDSFLLLRAPRRAERIALVVIDEVDYRERFRSRSPLDPAPLQEILNAIAAGRPALLGVDLDTSAPEHRSLQAPAGIPVVWARGAHETEPGRLELEPVLGGREPPKAGLAGVVPDADGVVRRYLRSFPIRGGTTLNWEIARAVATPCLRREIARGDADLLRHPGEPVALLYHFAGGAASLPRYPARLVLDGARNPETWGRNGPLTGRIVLLGGTYRAARDRHVTPLGMLAGVDLVALAVESDLSCRGVREAAHWVLALLDLASGTLLVSLHYISMKRCWPLRRVLLLSLLAIPALAVAASAVVFHTAGYWLSSLPLLAGVFIHQLYETGKHYREMYLAERYSQ
ncbi:MAG: CHASE2 domain-containing protein [Thermoanaerobaculia bacterium]